MIDTKELRRLAQEALAGPDGISLNWIKLLQDFQQEANPAAISEILDRLEAAESEALEEARLNGMGSEREAALMAKLEAVEKERGDVAQRLVQSEQGKRKISEERDALRDKIEEMEQQEPVAEIGQQYTLLFVGSGSITGVVKRHGLKIGDKLYALPGAQGEQS